MSQDGATEVVGLPPGTAVSLTVIRGPDSGMRLEFSGPRATIGRKKGDLLVTDRECSGQHAAIEMGPDGLFVLRDLGSTNGTFLDGRRVTISSIASGQQLKCGANYLLFTVSTADDGADTRHLEVAFLPVSEDDPLGLLSDEPPAAAPPSPAPAPAARVRGPAGAPPPVPAAQARGGGAVDGAHLEEVGVPAEDLSGLPGLPAEAGARTATGERTATVPARRPAPPPPPAPRPFSATAAGAAPPPTRAAGSAELPPLPPAPSFPAPTPPPLTRSGPRPASPSPAAASSIPARPPEGAAPPAPAAPPPPVDPPPASQTFSGTASRPFGGPAAARAGAGREEPLPEGVSPSPYGIYLLVERGPDAGLVVPLSRETTVLGRSETDVVLNDPDVSRRHAALDIMGEGKYVLRDLASTNGTLLNGIRARSEPIANNDKIRMGGTTIKFVVGTGRIASELRRVQGA